MAYYPPSQNRLMITNDDKVTLEYRSQGSIWNKKNLHPSPEAGSPISRDFKTVIIQKLDRSLSGNKDGLSLQGALQRDIDNYFDECREHPPGDNFTNQEQEALVVLALRHIIQRQRDFNFQPPQRPWLMPFSEIKKNWPPEALEFAINAYEAYLAAGSPKSVLLQFRASIEREYEEDRRELYGHLRNTPDPLIEQLRALRQECRDMREQSFKYKWEEGFNFVTDWPNFPFEFSRNEAPSKADEMEYMFRDHICRETPLDYWEEQELQEYLMLCRMWMAEEERKKTQTEWGLPLSEVESEIEADMEKQQEKHWRETSIEGRMASFNLG